MDQFVNDTDTLVQQAVDGVVRASGGRLARLDGFPHTKVVVRADVDRSKVAVISGGGSGHEPAHAGFVGEGMLTAAVCGEIFASPSADAILAGILAVTGDAGCLLVVKNYTGDRLNFGLAAERARERGLAVELVIVDDDVALPDLAQPRGLAGTLLVHRIAGASAERGDDLATVTAAAQRTVDGLASLGMALDTCAVPGSPKEERIDDGRAELGLGIHNEPGVEQVDHEGAAEAMRLVVDRITANEDKDLTGDAARDGHLVALLNNLGGATHVELSVLTRELAASEIGDAIDWLVGPAPLMTSLDMRGFSLTLLRTDDDGLAALRSPAGPPAWPVATAFGELAVQSMPDGREQPTPEPSDDPAVRDVLTRCCEALLDAADDLDALDAKTGDGDTGATVTSAANDLLAARDELPLADVPALFRAVGRRLSSSMGGSSGVLLAIYFAAAADAADDGEDTPAALRAGLERIMEVGGAGPGDRTMIDALAPALDALDDGYAAAADAAREGADATAEMTSAGAGRASYVPADKLEGHVDPGAEAVARLFAGLADGA